MKKRLLPILLACILCLAALCPVALALDPNADASLTLHYQKEGLGFENLDIGIYRVAQASANDNFDLIAPFDSYPISIHGITAQEQWHRVAQTLWSYIVANGVEPDRVGLTDAAGTVRFENLDIGLYFVREVVVDHDTGTYIFNQFMVYVPTPQTDGSYIYHVEAKPKCTSFVPKTHYSVTKLWQDEGYQTVRPQEVTVQIYRDGQLWDTQILNAQNNWTYQWSVSGEEPGSWTVAEISVPDSYKVTVQENNGAFFIINTRRSGSDIPQTGDSFSPLLWMGLLCLSGMGLLLLGIYSRRRK